MPTIKLKCKTLKDKKQKNDFDNIEKELEKAMDGSIKMSNMGSEEGSLKMGKMGFQEIVLNNFIKVDDPTKTWSFSSDSEDDKNTKDDFFLNKILSPEA